MIRQAVSGAVLTVILCSVAFADDPGPEGKAAAINSASSASKEFIPAQKGSELLVRELLSAGVIGAAGKDIGSVKDIIVNRTGRMVGVVVGVGGVLGIGGKGVAVPFSHISVARSGSSDALVLRTDLTREQVDAAPEFRSSADLKQASLSWPS